MADLQVAVTPRAAFDRVGPYREGTLRVRVTRPPSDGEANDAMRRLVARALGVPASAVRVVSGERSRRKRLSVAGLSADQLTARLALLADD